MEISNRENGGGGRYKRVVKKELCEVGWFVGVKKEVDFFYSF